MKKNIIALGSLVVLISIIGLGYYFGFKGDVASANPDYICVKSVSAQPCKNVTWGAWQLDHTRTGIGTKVAQVGYYHIRTSCEAGYSVKKSGKFHYNKKKNGEIIYIDGHRTFNFTKSTRKYITNGSLIGGLSSGRHSTDFNWSSTSCTVTQVDKIAPVGTFK